MFSMFHYSILLFIQSQDYENYQQASVAPPRPEKSEDKQREIHRMTSLRVHQALMQSHNNNNNNSNKQWQQSPPEEVNNGVTNIFYIEVAGDYFPT